MSTQSNIEKECAFLIYSRSYSVALLLSYSAEAFTGYLKVLQDKAEIERVKHVDHSIRLETYFSSGFWDLLPPMSFQQCRQANASFATLMGASEGMWVLAK